MSGIYNKILLDKKQSEKGQKKQVYKKVDTTDCDSKLGVH